MWHGPDEKPNPGMRIITPYNDGSGAVMFLVVDGEDGGISLIDQDGDEYTYDYLSSKESFSFWAELPEGSELWFEETAENQVTPA